MKLSPRIKSLKAILAHKNFAIGVYNNKSKNCKNYPHCAIGYTIKANKLKIYEYQNNFKLNGLNAEETDEIIRLNDKQQIKELHEYCQKLLDKELNAQPS